MVESKKIMAIWFATIIIVSALLIGWATLSNRSNEATGVEGNHFSVVWKGFKPTYSDQFPDYYVCINNLKDESLQMYIQLKIENYENVSLYFMIDKYAEPPTGWYVSPQYFGFIAITDPIKTFTYCNFARTKPTAIPQGSLHESVELAVKAYYDSSYTQFYSQANFTVNFHFIDVTAPVWTKVIYNNFDDETTQGWYGPWVVKWQYYRSWPCSLYCYNVPQKTFDLFGNYTEAYFVAAVITYPPNLWIALDGTICFQSELTTSNSNWLQIAIPLPLNRANAVMIGGLSYMDDVYVVAK
jgi:hypothetical protein